ncbi:MAG: LPS-assembly protein LptD [Cocleimonas sp.]
MNHASYTTQSHLSGRFLLIGLLLITHKLSYAETFALNEQWAQCSISAPQKTQSNPSTTSKIIETPFPDAIYLEADDGTISLSETSILKGHVIIQRNETIFNADNATFNRKDNVVIAQGNVILSTKGLELKSDAIEYKLKNHTGIIKGAEYTVGSEGAHGKSSQINQIDSTHLQLNDATFTTCPAVTSLTHKLTDSPKVSSWHLASSDIKLNQKTQIGTAKNVTFNVLDIPVFYFPWLKFPINNQRLSGLLSPKLRLETNAGVSIPYYLNLAPNYDATITFATLAGHGYQFDSEFRYLSKRHNGTLNYVFIPKDKSFDSPSGDKKRDYFKIEHSTHFNKTSSINLTAEGVSDDAYFDDFSTSLETSSRSALQRRFEFTNIQAPWQVSAAVEDYQILDINDAPYAKLPEIKLSYIPKKPSKALKLKVESELVYFDKKDATTGSRANIKLSASKKWGSEAWFLKPGFNFEHSLYSLNNAKSESISRSLPTLTFDTGLFFDRELKKSNLIFGKALIQTLEPRLLYTYTPYKDQNNIPVFDTARANFSETTQLFSPNRFTGKDRIADANQLTFAVSSRIQDRKVGKELLKASIGQIFYFSDRRVTLPEGSRQTDTKSDLVLELSGRLNDNLQITSVGLWDYEDKHVSSYELRLNYQDRRKRILNLAYRELDKELTQVALSTALPINDKWSLVASTEHDLKNDRNLESLLGIEYRSCCVKTRLVAKRYLTADNENYETPIFLEFELKGLGNIGTGDASNQLKDKIYGYDDY